jgi:hypothetical protein
VNGADAYPGANRKRDWPIETFRQMESVDRGAGIDINMLVQGVMTRNLFHRDSTSCHYSTSHHHGTYRHQIMTFEPDCLKSPVK